MNQFLKPQVGDGVEHQMQRFIRIRDAVELMKWLDRRTAALNSNVMGIREWSFSTVTKRQHVYCCGDTWRTKFVQQKYRSTRSYRSVTRSIQNLKIQKMDIAPTDSCHWCKPGQKLYQRDWNLVVFQIMKFWMYNASEWKLLNI